MKPIKQRRSVAGFLKLGPFAVLALIGLALQGGGCPPQGPTQTSQTIPFVRGYIVAAVGQIGVEPFVATHVPAGGIPLGFLRDIYVPGVDVFLENLVTSEKSQPVRTDLSGRFTLPAFKKGRYRVCWKAQGFGAACSQNVFSVSPFPVHIGNIRIPVERKAGMTVVFGRVRMADGSLPRLLEPIASVNAFARVALLNNNNQLLHEAFVNNFGDYLLPQVPVKQKIILRATMEGVSTDQLIQPEANLDKAPVHPINLKIRNHPPRLEPVVPQDLAGRRVKVASPGDTVELRARVSDKDGDLIKFTWLVADGSGTLSTTTASPTRWTLPSQPGMYSVTLLAYDGKGGYAQSPLSLRADGLGVPFSGHVVDGTTGGPVPGAQVEINGKLGTTDAAGFFVMRVPDADRFVLNIRKPGFGLVSRIYDNSIIGGRWTMTRATVVTVNPSQSFKAINERRPTDCPGPLSAQLDWRTYKHLLVPQWQDGKGNVVVPYGQLEVPLPRPRPEQEKHKQCGPGIQVEIPANALVDSNGNPPPGNVQVALSTVDLMSPDQMPGDYTVQQPDGTTRVMQSYGAGGIEITSGATRYNLRAGTEATVTLPVDPSQLAAGGALPPTIPVLFYEELNGVWIPEGTATLQGTVYVAKVKHLSAINTDTIKVNQSCVRIKSPTLPPTYNLEWTIPMGPPVGPPGSAPKVQNNLINNASPSEHVIYNLPSNVNIVLVPIRIANNIPMGTFVVNTGGPQNPLTPNLPVGPPYEECATEVILTEQAVPPPPTGEFLHGLFSFAATNLDELDPSDPTQLALKQALDLATQNYYDQIDPRDLRQTVADFRSVNGFNVSETQAVYANSGDLGFGRDMHCTRKTVTALSGFDVACYVTNYGDIVTSDTQDVADAVCAVQPSTPGCPATPPGAVATVAMEFSRIEDAGAPGSPITFSDPQRVVKFYVYNAAGNQLLRNANLDNASGPNLGARPIPQLCMVCHGGQYPGGITTGVPPFNSPADVKLGSVFLPFDLHFFTFSSTAGFTKVDQQAEFRTLNQDMVAQASNPAIQEVITGMYAAGTTQDENFIVTGWNAQPNERVMYRDVVARACRTCHVANPVTGLQFTQRVQTTDDATARLGRIEDRVCDEHIMPHAKRTHEIFWTSVGPHMPAQLQVFGDAFDTPANGWQGNKCGVFTGGGTTPTSPLYAAANAVFADRCDSCHIGSSPPGNLDLSGDPYLNVFNVAACELPSMKRIAPGGGTTALANSYLVHKIDGTQGGLAGCPATVPASCNPFSPTTAGCGATMPLGGSLSTAEKNDIKNWVSAGAPH